jgi:hypothetical protein
MSMGLLKLSIHNFEKTFFGFIYNILVEKKISKYNIEFKQTIESKSKK